MGILDAVAVTVAVAVATAAAALVGAATDTAAGTVADTDAGLAATIFPGPPALASVICWDTYMIECKYD